MRRGTIKKANNKNVEAEAAFAAGVYRNRGVLNRRAQSVLAIEPSHQVTIRLNHTEIALARQAEVKGLKYQTCIKMLLHEGVRRNITF